MLSSRVYIHGCKVSRWRPSSMFSPDRMVRWFLKLFAAKNLKNLRSKKDGTSSARFLRTFDFLLDDTVDGSDIRRGGCTGWGKGSWNPMIYRVLAPSQVVFFAGFLNHQRTKQGSSGSFQAHRAQKRNASAWGSLWATRQALRYGKKKQPISLGSNVKYYCWWKNPANHLGCFWNRASNGLNYLNWLAGFLPSTVGYHRNLGSMVRITGLFHLLMGYIRLTAHWS